MRLQRQVVDYALRRRSLLAEVYSGRTGVSEVCDANPYLLRAAKFHGKPSSVMCPICRKEQLTLVSWVFGDHLGAVSGSARTAEELVLLASRYDEFSVHVVEVCRTCSWNHLVKSYVLGAVPPTGPSRGGGPRGAPRRRAVVRARPVNSEGRRDRSVNDVRKGHGADGVSEPEARRPDGAGRHRPPQDAPSADRTRPVAPDDRHTSVLPPVRDQPPPHLRDPIDVVKAALDGTPAPKPAPPSPPPPPPRRPPQGGRPPAGGPPPRRPGQHKSVNWTWVRRGLLAAAIVFLVLPTVTFAMAYLIVDVPKPGDIRTNQVSTILASDGSELAKIVPPEGNRVDVDIDQIPVHVRNAVMAAEDRNFYSNPGFSFTGFARAIKNNLSGENLQGGSTITQQYVKNALVGSERAGVGGLIRKAKELVISTKMSGEWSKDQVLQSYLNIIYFGRGSYGVAAASRAYFNKPVEELTVAEGRCWPRSSSGRPGWIRR